MSSLLPFLLEYDQPSRQLLNHRLSLTLTPEELVALGSPKYYRILSKLPLLRESASIKNNKENFQVNLDVQHFAPDEITVRTVDGFVIIEGRHEEKRDEHGWVSRQFTRRYSLPEGCDAESVQSRLSSDGVLTVIAPLKSRSSNERVVPIMQTGPVRTQGEPKADLEIPQEPTAPAPTATNGDSINPVQNGN